MMNRSRSLSLILIAMVLSPGLKTSAQTAVDFRQAIRGAQDSLTRLNIEPSSPRPGQPAGDNDVQPRNEQPKDEDPIEGPRLEWLELGPHRIPGRMNPLADTATFGVAFAVDSHLLIAYVGDRPDSASLVSAEGDELPTEIVAMDFVTGLAVLRAPDANLSPLTVGVAQTEPGMPVVAAWVEGGTLHSDAGMVSTAPIASNSGLGVSPKINFMSDDPMSGSVVLDSEGIVVGVLVPGMAGRLHCVPSASVLRLIDAAGQTPPQNLKRGLIGIQFRSDGPLVMEVRPESAASRAGIEAGDLVQKVGDTLVNDSGDVIAAVATARAGDELEITVLREGQSQTRSVILTEHPRQRMTVAASNLAPDLGRALGLQGAFELKDGTLVPIAPQGQAGPEGLPEMPFLPLPPGWNAPGNRGPIEGFQIERSEMEETLKELQRQLKRLNEKLDDQPDD